MKTQVYLDGTPARTSAPVIILAGGIEVGLGIFTGVKPNADGQLGNVMVLTELIGENHWTPVTPVLKCFPFTNLIAVEGIANVAGKWNRPSMLGAVTQAGVTRKYTKHHRSTAKAAA